jgi:hypothetical protein
MRLRTNYVRDPVVDKQVERSARIVILAPITKERLQGGWLLEQAVASRPLFVFSWTSSPCRIHQRVFSSGKIMVYKVNNIRRIRNI